LLCRDESAVATRSALQIIIERGSAMPKVIADITMSLDGYVTGPGPPRRMVTS
jgi:hypothetical protein